MPPVRKTRIEGQTIYGYMARVPPERMGPGDPDDPYSTLPGGNDSESVRLINTAGILNLRGDEKGAMRCYKAILERLPDNYVANYGVGTALRLAGKPRRAIAYLERAIRVWPENSMAHGSLGFALHDMGDYGDAIRSFDRALALQPDDPLALRGRKKAVKALGAGGRGRGGRGGGKAGRRRAGTSARAAGAT